MSDPTKQDQTSQPLVPQVITQPEGGLSIFGNSERFTHFQRVAQAFAASSLVPESFKGNVANALIALDMADRLKANPLAVMQSIYIVHGRPSWSATFIIAMINGSGRFRDPLDFELTGTGDEFGCIATGKSRATGKEVRGVRVTIGMAKKEGWFGRNGSKWQTMPELMLHYRAATFFGRLHCPDLLMGMKADDELIDVLGEPKAAPWKPEQGPVMAPAILQSDSVQVTGSLPTPEPPPPPPQAEPAKAKQGDPLSPQEVLQQFIETSGYDINQFLAFAGKEELIKGADSIASWDEIGIVEAKRIMRAKTGILNGLAQMFPEGGVAP